MSIGNQQDAEAAVDLQKRAVAYGAFDYGGTGVFAKWQWWRGSGRVAWRPRDGEVVYKVESSPGTNALEDENMNRWRAEGRAWRPIHKPHSRSCWSSEVIHRL